MTVFSVYALADDGSVILSRYFTGDVDASELVLFEQKLLVAISFGEEGNNNDKQYCNLSGIAVSYQRFHEITLIICGNVNNGTDEAVCGYLLDIVYEIFMEQSDSKKLLIRNILDTENYSKIMLALDEFAPEGFVESVNPDVINKASKMK